MSVKTLDDPEKEIDLADDLESFLHVLLHESSVFICNNCMGLEAFM